MTPRSQALPGSWADGPLRQRLPLLCWTVALALAVAVAVGWTLGSPATMFYPLLALFVLGFAPALLTFREHTVFLFYGMAFFTFIFGRMTVVSLFGYRRGETNLLGTYSTDPRALCTVLGVYFLFLIALLLVFWLPTTRIKTGWASARHRASRSFLGDTTRRPALLTFYAFLVPYVLYLVMVGHFVATEGYYAYQQDRSAAAPGMLRLFDDAMVLAFIVYLASRPRLKDLRLHGAVFVLARLGALVTMERNSAIVPILMFVAYLLARVPRSTRRAWLAPRRLLPALGGLGLVSVGSLWVLARMNATRGTGGRAVGMLQAPLELFYGQGTTINVGVLIERLGDQIPRNRFYSFGPLIEFFQLRIVHPFTGDFGYLASHNATRAAEGHQLAHTFSYAWMGEDYLEGASFGSSAPIELWLDFGMVGVVLGGAVTGLLLWVLSSWITGNFWQVIVTLLLVQGLWFSPRASFSEFLVAISVRTMLAGVLIAFVIAGWSWWRHRSGLRTPAAP